MRYVALFLILCDSFSNAQVFRGTWTLEVNGDAEVKVVPDRVSIRFGVETRNGGPTNCREWMCLGDKLTDPGPTDASRRARLLLSTVFAYGKCGGWPQSQSLGRR
jgi:hypothetical protein